MAAKNTRLVRVLEERGKICHEEQTIKKKKKNFTHPLFYSLPLFKKKKILDKSSHFANR